MDIELLNAKIIIQKNETISDEIGNHQNAWINYYSCHATVSGEATSFLGSEEEKAALTVDHSNLDFTIRWCDKAKVIDITHYRVLFNEESYNIIAIDHMNYKRKCLKLRCKKEER